MSKPRGNLYIFTQYCYHDSVSFGRTILCSMIFRNVHLCVVYGISSAFERGIIKIRKNNAFYYPRNDESIFETNGFLEIRKLI